MWINLILITIFVLTAYFLTLLRRHLILIKSLQHDNKMLRVVIWELVGYSSADLNALYLINQKLDHRLSYLESTITCVPQLNEIYKKILHPKEGGEIGQ